jgi:predicted GNAT family N-acyltransferase
MIRFIKVEDLLAIRNEVLREGKLTPDECRFPTDNIDGAFHLGCFTEDKLVCITSLFPKCYNIFTGAGYQLRGMATLEQYRGMGYGNQLVNFAVAHLHKLGADYVWCNARKKALKFYHDCGFEVVSEEFEVKGIGPHHVMCLNIA